LDKAALTAGLLPRLSLLCCLLLPSAFALAAELSVQLRAAVPAFKQGEAPAFVVTVTNTSTLPVEVINVLKRADLKDTYVRLSVTALGQPVDVPRFISDPGPISAADLLTLSPTQAFSFDHTGFPLALDKLSPGSYRARVEFYPNLGVGLSIVSSNSITFQVIR
jgi:hypothetical protein